MWLVMNIGCIECDVSSKIVGVFSDEARANAVAEACGEKYGWREGGQNAFEVHELPPPEAVDAEYDIGSNASLSGSATSAASGRSAGGDSWKAPAPENDDA